MAAAILDPFYLIVGDVAELERLLPLGVRLVQLRLKGLGEDALRRHKGSRIRAAADLGISLLLSTVVFWAVELEKLLARRREGRAGAPVGSEGQGEAAL